ncbi:MAG: pseudouridylate synthase [Cyclobacteriaceae bacterium]|nr:pseudouridylate synthase [Cyclobacteriaceae bacterium]MCH8516044.1 pseudouridylate synthase [Cyclobacteriaceae bacterium]
MLSKIPKISLIHIDQNIAVVDKPNDLVVHPTKMSAHDEFSTLHLLKQQVGRRVTPVHRLDRGTSGVLVFSFHKDVTQKLTSAFENRKVAKEYYALVRGHTPDELLIDRPLKKPENGNVQTAQTMIYTLARWEIDVPLGLYTTSRFSWIRVVPHTGRYHQIRRHLSGVNHPIIGDHKHGDHRYNQFLRDIHGVKGMMLHARQISFNMEEKDFLFKTPIPIRMIVAFHLLDTFAR